MTASEIQDLRDMYATARELVEVLEDECSPAQEEARNTMYRLQDELRANDPDYTETMTRFSQEADAEFNAMLEAGIL